MTKIVEVANATRSYGTFAAIDDVSFSLYEHGIYGLLGRNGAGKTTLMQLLAGQDFADGGSIEVFGETPAENAAVLSQVCFVRESQVYPDSFKVKHLLKIAPRLFPNWDAAYAERLVKEFDIPLKPHIKKMSRGQRSAVGVVVGLASRAPLTLFDEPYAGLDAVARHILYDQLLADYAENPRTIVFSTHLIDEVSDLLSHVLVLVDGKIIIDSDTDTLRCEATTVTGGKQKVEAFAVGREVIGSSSMMGIESLVITGMTDADRSAALDAGLELGGVSLQELVVYRTTSHSTTSHSTTSHSTDPQGASSSGSLSAGTDQEVAV